MPCTASAIACPCLKACWRHNAGRGQWVAMTLRTDWPHHHWDNGRYQPIFRQRAIVHGQGHFEAARHRVALCDTRALHHSLAGFHSKGRNVSCRCRALALAGPHLCCLCAFARNNDGACPYPFRDAGALGYAIVICNIRFLLIFFFLLALALVVIDLWLGHIRQAR